METLTYLTIDCPICKNDRDKKKCCGFCKGHGELHYIGRVGCAQIDYEAVKYREENRLP